MLIDNQTIDLPTSTKVWIHLFWYGAVLLFVIVYVVWVRFRDANSDRQSIEQKYRLRIQEANARSRRPTDPPTPIAESVEQVSVSNDDRKISADMFDSHKK